MSPAPRMSLSAVVPALDEAAGIARALESLRAAGVDEVVVVDGGSRDGTPERARGLADRVLEARGGLFAQLEAGARAARGDALLFHYADGLLPRAGGEGVRRLLARRGVAGGAFAIGFQSGQLRYRVVAWGAGWRNRLGVGPFGDQTIFLHAGAFHALGGFRREAPLPDFDLVRRLRRLGEFRILDDAVLTSTRRWEERGFTSTLLLHWWLTFSCLAGSRGLARRGAAAAERLRLRDAQPPALRRHSP